MMRVGAIILLGLMAAGCTVPKATKIPLTVSANSIAEMRGTHSVLQKRKLASLNCRKAGYRKRTAPYYQCMRALIARDLQRTREVADNYSGNLIGASPAAPRDKSGYAFTIRCIGFPVSIGQPTLFIHRPDQKIDTAPHGGRQ